MSNNLIHSLKWSMASEIASKAIQPIIFILLARMLTPEDFGVMAAALMVISFSQIFWDAGMGKTLIQRQTDIEEASNAAFWINIALGCTIAAILYIIASPVANIFFHDPRVTAVLQIMTIQVFLGAVSAVHTARLQKEMKFNKLFWVRFATVSLPGLASIPLAWNGMGYWALVVGTLIGQIAQAIILWRLSSWRPSLTFNTRVSKEMARFGAWVGASGLLAWFYMWADSLIVGMYLGSHELGLYRTGSQFAMMIFALIFGPIVPVLYSHFAKMDGDKKRLAHAIERVIKVLIIVSIPVAFILFSLSNPIGSFVFGEKWHGIDTIIGVVALSLGFSWIAGINGEVYRAIGKPYLETNVMALPLVIYLIAYLISIRYGLDAFIWTRLGLAIGALFLHFIILRRLLSLATGKLIKFIVSITLLAIIITQINVNIMEILFISEWMLALVGSVVSAVLLALTIYFIERKEFMVELKRIYQRYNA